MSRRIANNKFPPTHPSLICNTHTIQSNGRYCFGSFITGPIQLITFNQHAIDLSCKQTPIPRYMLSRWHSISTDIVSVPCRATTKRPTTVWNAMNRDYDDDDDEIKKVLWSTHPPTGHIEHRTMFRIDNSARKNGFLLRCRKYGSSPSMTKG